ncbi:MAG: PIG-L family deacetylase [Planctomycetes bacterium]|nr:PIG-L family deacetylase [Planctomycetota bacterium]
MALRVLGFMAHPDDVEFTCAGTMIRLKQEAGCEVAIATSTSGDCGTVEHRPDEIARIRHREAKASADLLGAEYYCAGCMDLFVMYDDPTLRRFVEVVRKARPDIVITQPRVDYMIDHENTGRLVRSACFAAPIPNVWTNDPDPAPLLPKVPYLYYCDPPEGKEIYGDVVSPQFVVDVTGVMPLKTDMLACHASQREWLRKHHEIDEYIEAMKRGSAARGKLIGKPYGEGFRQHLGHGYPQDNIIAKLLKV